MNARILIPAVAGVAMTLSGLTPSPGRMIAGVDWSSLDWTSIAALIIQILWAFGWLKPKEKK